MGFKEKNKKKFVDDPPVEFLNETLEAFLKNMEQFPKQSMGDFLKSIPGGFVKESMEQCPI